MEAMNKLTISFLIAVCLILSFSSTSNAWVPRIVNKLPKSEMLRAPGPSQRTLPPPELWFEFQKLDHFSGRDYRWWKQRYWMNETLYKPGGPVFLMLSGAEEADPMWMVDGAWIQYAQIYKAMLVMLEHRFYGFSQPLLNISTHSLQYLSSRQALADVANFINFFWTRYDLNETNKLITFGGFYGGSLAAWFRSKYPYMSVGAVASSAPLLAKVDFMEYFEVIKTAVDSLAGPNCAVEILNATQTMLMWWGDEEKRKEIQTMFQLCDKIHWHGQKHEVEDLAGVFSSLAQNFADTVIFYKEKHPKTTVTIEDACNVMTNVSRGLPVQRYADVNKIFLKAQSKPCLDFYYTKILKEMRPNGWNTTAAKLGVRQFLYQACTEFGWFLSSDSYKQPFGDWFSFPWNYTGDLCVDIFRIPYLGNIFDNIDEMNRYYGGLKLPSSNIALPNGSLDPWHAISITNTTGTDADVIYIEGTAHIADMLPPSDQDPPQLVAARQKIAQLIGKWLS